MDLYRTTVIALDDADVAIMAFAEKIALNAYKVTAEDIAALRDHGMDDPEIFNLALAAAARSFFSKALDSMGAQPDEAFGASSELFDLVQVAPLRTG